MVVNEILFNLRPFLIKYPLPLIFDIEIVILIRMFFLNPGVAFIPDIGCAFVDRSHKLANETKPNQLNVFSFSSVPFGSHENTETSEKYLKFN